MKIFFYYLIDPRTEEIKYIGQTKNVMARLSNHIYSANHDKREQNSRKSIWVRELLSLGLRPQIKIFEEFNGDVYNAHRREWEIIIQHLDKGYTLLNNNDGGCPHYLLDENLKKVYQYDINSLQLLREYRCAFDAYCVTGIKDGNIIRSCLSINKNRLIFAGGFLWSHDMYNIFPKDKLLFSTLHNKKKIKAIKIVNNTEYVFESAREAAKKLNCSYKQISACCLGQHKSHNGYLFSFI
jgi:hypothetical protein